MARLKKGAAGEHELSGLQADRSSPARSSHSCLGAVTKARRQTATRGRATLLKGTEPTSQAGAGQCRYKGSPMPPTTSNWLAAAYTTTIGAYSQEASCGRLLRDVRAAARPPGMAYILNPALRGSLAVESSSQPISSAAAPLCRRSGSWRPP